MVIGVDVGNYDVKTQNCTIAAGYKEYDVKPELATKVLEYNGKYYVPDVFSRLPYRADKTTDNSCIILTLFGMAEEILFNAKEEITKRKEKCTVETMQAEIDRVRHTKLGLGLPPGDINSLKVPTTEYYEKCFENGVTFIYKNYKFKFTVDKIRIFPQDFAAVFKNVNCKTAERKRYYIVGIGGGTVDVTEIMDGRPNHNGCFSLILGTRIMYSKISADVQRQHGVHLDENLVEDVLKDEYTVLNEDVKDLVKKNAKNHVDAIVNECIQNGISLNLYPTVFFGGGCILLEKYILENKMLKNPEIFKDVRANAKAFAKYIDL